ncbi:hypothetical protein [Flavobacterium wongokense]|uniref:hypothetical protein n=1 Tax=Flavobacterium wongokense TaxID=2910674 RepID=UPI001F2ADBDD|nr:hypothetical protein [Flavobacterium sp. WG47]MCF6131416.1 hypothetical protein [Flavobacterium sp. WG47]
MKKILIAFAALLFLSCSSDDGTAVRRVSFKADGVYKIYEDIRVTKTVDNNWEVPITRLDISAQPKDGTPESFALRVIRGGEYDGQSTNGGAFIAGKGYNYNFDHPIEMHLTINSDKRMKGTFEGIFTNSDGENIQITNGKIDITYYPDNPEYIKK